MLTSLAGTTLHELPVLVWVMGLSAVVAAVTVIVRQLLLPMHRGVRKLQAFLDEWNGEPARPGHPRQPGVVERLAAVETDMKAVAHEVHANDGSSIKDSVARIETRLQELAERDAAIKADLARKYAESVGDRRLIRRRLDRHEKAMERLRLLTEGKIDDLLRRVPDPEIHDDDEVQE